MQFLKNIAVVAKHLEKNEKYLHLPETKIKPQIHTMEINIKRFEKEMQLWERYLE